MARREVPEAPPDRASPAGSQFAVTAPATPEGRARPVSAEVAPLPTVDRAVYEILGEHSRGGLGRILRARDTRTGRVVAIKEMLRADDDAVAARFAREAMLTANLQHPAIVPVYEVGRWPDGQPFYAMKLVAGRSLAEAIRDAPSRRDRLALLSHVTAVAGALAYAHDLGVVHRDLKPANVLVGRFGETVVIDWGLAKDVAEAEGQAEPVAAAASGSLTVAGTLLGTPAYMPPEQARGETVDERADVYALGAMLYHVLAGAMPYAASSSGDEILEQVRAGPPRPLLEIDPELPADLVAIADKAMAHDPAGRYATAGALAVDLERFATGQLVSAHVYSPGQLLRRWARRHRAALAVAAAAALTLAAVGVYSLQRVRGERDEATAQRGVAEKALVSAEAANREASRSLAALRRELGRQELDAGDPMRALAHLDEAARRSGRIDAGLAYMVGRAADALAPRRWSARSDSRALDRMAVSADGAIALTAGADGVVERWDLATGRRLGRMNADGVVSAALSPDGRMAAIASTSEVVLWDGRSIRAAAGPRIGCRLLARGRPARRRRQHRRGRDPTGRRCSATAQVERAPRRCHKHRVLGRGYDRHHRPGRRCGAVGCGHRSPPAHAARGRRRPQPAGGERRAGPTHHHDRERLARGGHLRNDRRGCSPAGAALGRSLARVRAHRSQRHAGGPGRQQRQRGPVGPRTSPHRRRAARPRARPGAGRVLAGRTARHSRRARRSTTARRAHRIAAAPSGQAAGPAGADRVHAGRPAGRHVARR